jgi:hypothetical protein
MLLLLGLLIVFVACVAGVIWLVFAIVRALFDLIT